MDFSLSIDNWCDKAEKDVETIVRESFIGVAKRLIGRTPFGQPELWVKHRAPPGYVPGQARAGWHYSSGVPVVSLPERPDAGGTATLAAIVADLPAKMGGKVHFLSNNVVYIEELERGHSRLQAPQGMVGLTVIEFEGIVHEKALEVVH